MTAITKREVTGMERLVFARLNYLKEKKRITIVGVTPEVLMEYGFKEKDSKYLIKLWQKNYNEEGDYELITPLS